MELPDKMPFNCDGKYKLGAVTYEVTAHFCLEAETLKSKIDHLLKTELQKSNSVCTFADGQRGDVK